MDCPEARKGLWPPERPKLLARDVAAADQHVAECPDCRAYFAQDRLLLDLYDRVRDHPAPDALRERLAKEIESASDDRSRSTTAVGARSRTWTVAAGIVPVALAGGLGAIALSVFTEPPAAEASDDATVFVQDYLRRAVSADFVVTSDAAVVRRFLERELGMRVEPLLHADLELVKAEICLLDGTRGAMIVYERGGVAVSHYLIPRPGTRDSPPRLIAGEGGADRGAMPVVIWSTREVEQALVAEVPTEELLRWASPTDAPGP